MYGMAPGALQNPSPPKLNKTHIMKAGAFVGKWQKTSKPARSWDKKECPMERIQGPAQS